MVRARFLLVMIAAAASCLVACTSDGDGSTPAPTQNPATIGAADLSSLNASETEAEIIRLLGEGYWMYTKTRVFTGTRSQASPSAFPCQTTPVVCDTYPEVIVDESWVSTDPLGRSLSSLGRRSDEDGTVLATQLQGEWTDLSTGETWTSAFFPRSDTFRSIRQSFTKIERETERGLEGVDGEILGRPSKVFPAGEFEFQVANPLIQRTTRWQDDGNGDRQKVSELVVLDFAMLPPESLPDFAPDGLE